MNTVIAVVISLTVALIAIRLVSKAKKVKGTKNEPMYILTQEEFKSLCELVSYEEIARYPDRYINKKIKLIGRVFQVLGLNKNIEVLLDADPKKSLLSKIIKFEYKRKTPAEPRIIYDDRINIYGIYKGLKTYRTVLKAEEIVPYVEVEYIEINPTLHEVKNDSSVKKAAV